MTTVEHKALIFHPSIFWEILVWLLYIVDKCIILFMRYIIFRKIECKHIMIDWKFYCPTQIWATSIGINGRWLIAWRVPASYISRWLHWLTIGLELAAATLQLVCTWCWFFINYQEDSVCGSRTMLEIGNNEINCQFDACLHYITGATRETHHLTCICILMFIEVS